VWYRVDIAGTDVSDELVAFIFKVVRISVSKISQLKNIAKKH
jgi:hypothetical protein